MPSSTHFSTDINHANHAPKRLESFCLCDLASNDGAQPCCHPLVEIIAFAHPPVVSALKPLRDWLGAQGNKVKLIEIDMESAEGQKRLAAMGVKGHTPILILINGR
jgi:hypothetical protein